MTCLDSCWWRPFLAWLKRAVAAARGLALTQARVVGDHWLARLISSSVRHLWRCLRHWGQLGDGFVDPRGTPVGVRGLDSGVVAIAANYAHTCALTDQGRVLCWGYNAFGQLGDGGDFTSRSTPVVVSGF